MKEAVAEAGEKVSDIMAEAKAERAAGATEAAAVASQAILALGAGREAGVGSIRGTREFHALSRSDRLPWRRPGTGLQTSAPIRLRRAISVAVRSTFSATLAPRFVREVREPPACRWGPEK